MGLGLLSGSAQVGPLNKVPTSVNTCSHRERGERLGRGTGKPQSPQDQLNDHVASGLVTSVSGAYRSRHSRFPVTASSLFAELAFLTQLAQSSGAKNIHLIAHSMGNRALVKALKQLTVTPGGRPFKQIVLTAPDVPRQNIEPLITAASKAVGRGPMSTLNGLLTVVRRTWLDNGITEMWPVIPIDQ